MFKSVAFYITTVNETRSPSDTIHIDFRDLPDSVEVRTGRHLPM